MRDPEVFPEKEMDPGSIYVEAADKVTLKKIRDITFVNANDVLGIMYKSKSGHSKLNWRQQSGPMGRVFGDASHNSLVNLSMAGVISPEDVEELVNREDGHDAEPRETAPEAESSGAQTGSGTGGVAASTKPPIAGDSGMPPDEEEEEDFEAADADEDEQEDVEEQAREETV